MINLSDDASLPDDISALEAEIAFILQAQKDCEALLRKLVSEEDPANGVFFAQEIHEARHTKLRLEVQKELRRVRINRIRLGIEPF